jgi:GNAT superfamily N-acetyltransferase
MDLKYRSARISELRFVFSLIQEMARDRVANPAYLQTSHRIGLAQQLFGLKLLDRLLLPDGVPYKGHLQIALRDNRAVGYWIERETAWRSYWRSRELYLICVAREHRGMGVGRTILRHILDGLPAGCGLVSYCVARATAMRRLLASSGFIEQDATPPGGRFERVSRFLSVERPRPRDDSAANRPFPDFNRYA